MKRFGIHNGADLKAWSELELAQRFGKMGRHYFRIVRAMDKREVKPDRLRKSVGAENTFNEDLTEEAEMLEKITPLVEKVCERLQRIRTGARTITLKIKYHDFIQTTRSRSTQTYVNQVEEIFPTIKELLHQPRFPEKPVRLLGVYMSNLDNENDEGPRQLTLEF